MTSAAANPMRHSREMAGDFQPSDRVVIEPKPTADSAVTDERLRRALSIETVGVLFFNLDGRMTDANAAFLRMSGYSLEELRTTVHWEVLTPPEFRAATARAAAELATRGETHRTRSS